MLPLGLVRLVRLLTAADHGPFFWQSLTFARDRAMRIALVSIALIGFVLAGCVGRPIPIPYPESELGPPPSMPGASELAPAPGAFTGSSGEWVIYRKQ